MEPGLHQMSDFGIVEPLGGGRGGAAAFAPRFATALVAGAGRQLTAGLGAVRDEVRGWRSRAERIPDPVLRADALAAAEKRYYVDGAALFWILPTRRNRELLALLVAYQTIANYLDCASERGAAHRGGVGGSLMLALVDAVDVDGPVRDYYADHPWSDDGGYLAALVRRCRAACATLPRYAQARPLLLEQARQGRALELCHDPDAARRDDALRGLIAEGRPSHREAAWFEVVGSATSLLGVVALLAVAADPGSSEADLRAAAAAYIPWVGAVSLMLDSYIDQAHDAATGSWSAIGYYPGADVAQARVASLIVRALDEVATLRNGERHVVVVSCMLAMYLTSDDARAPGLASGTRALRDAGGPLSRGLMPVLRAWRLVYRQHR